MEEKRTNTKYSNLIVSKIYKNLREGNTQEDSARLAGISVETYHNWLKRYQEFKNGVEANESINKKKTLKLLQKHGKKSWQALAWWLERRFYGDYMAKSSTKIEGNGGVQIAIVSGGYIPQLSSKQPLQVNTEAGGVSRHDISAFEASDTNGKQLTDGTLGTN